VPRRVDEVQGIRVSVRSVVVERDGVRFDRDPALALEIHRIEQLLGHVALFDGVREFEKTIRKGRLPVVDVRDDAEVADSLRNGSAV